MWNWIKDKWNRFQDWCASWMPGFKTRIVAALGVIGSVAAMMQDWVTGLPLSTFMTATQVAMVSAVLFSLAFWFRGLTNREV